MSDPLDELIVDECEALDKNLLASIVTGYVRITKTGEVLFDKSFYNLPQAKKVVLCLLSRKIIKIKNLIDNFEEGIRPAEISKLTGIKPKNVTGYLSNDLKGLTISSKGAHIIPNYNLYKCEELMRLENSKGSSY